MTEFFQMGGYGAYVWSAYALAGLLMIVVFVLSWASWRRNEKTLAALKSVQGQSRNRGAA